MTCLTDAPPLVLNVPSMISVDQALIEIKRKSDSYYASKPLPVPTKLKMQVRVTDEIIANVFGDDLVGEVFQTNPASCVVALAEPVGKKRKAAKSPAPAPAKKSKTNSDSSSSAVVEKSVEKSPKKKKKGSTKKVVVDSDNSSGSDDAETPKVVVAKAKKVRKKLARSKSAYLFFCDAMRPKMKGAGKDLARQMGAAWRELSEKDRKPYDTKAAKAKAALQKKQKAEALQTAEEVGSKEATAPAPSETAGSKDASASAPSEKVAKKVRKKKKPKDPNAPPKPQIPFLRFNREVQAERSAGNKLTPKEVSALWKSEDSAGRRKRLEDISAKEMKTWKVAMAKYTAQKEGESTEDAPAPKEQKKASKKKKTPAKQKPSKEMSGKSTPKPAKKNKAANPITETPKPAGKKAKKKKSKSSKKKKELN